MNELAQRPGRTGGILAWFARNHVAANLLMAFIIMAGLMALGSIRRELIPAISLDLVTVTVPYPGATPIEVEDGIVRLVEEALGEVDGIERITATAGEGAAVLVVEIVDGAEVQAVLADVKTRIDAISTFPAEAERAIVDAPRIEVRVSAIAVSGDLAEDELRLLAQQVRDGLTARDDITRAELAAARRPELAIEVSDASLRRYGLDFDRLAQAVRGASIDLPAGSLRRREGEALLRTRAQAWRADDYASLVLEARPDGSVLRLADVAIVRETFAETDLEAHLDGRPAVFINVYRTGNEDILAVAAGVRAHLDEIATSLPAGARVEVVSDESDYFRDRLRLLSRNALQGLVLVFLVLALFLRLRLAFWVAFGLPVCFLGALALLPQVDVSLNMVSMFAFILVLGILIDDAIVVGESVHAESEDGHADEAAAIRGVGRIARPVVFAVLTTVIAFLPMLFISGPGGKFWRQIPLVVISCLAFSLIESLLILPAHLGERRPWILRLLLLPILPLVELGRLARLDRAWAALRSTIDRGLNAFLDHVYQPLLRRALHRRYLTVALFVAMLIVTIGAVMGDRIPFTGFPVVQADFISATYELPIGSHIEDSRRVIDRLETAALRLREQHQRSDGPPIFARLITAIGARPITGGRPSPGGGARGDAAPHQGELVLFLAADRPRNLDVQALAVAWAREAGEIPGLRRLDISADLSRRGTPIDLQLSHQDPATLRRAIDELRAALRAFDGTYAIRDSLEDGKQELVFSLSPAGAAAGLRSIDLARQLRAAIFGLEVQRLQRGRDEIRVMLRLPPDERAGYGDLGALRLRLPDGGDMPLATAATWQEGSGPAAITRVDRRRSATVQAEVDPARGTAGLIMRRLQDDILPSLVAQHRGLTWDRAGSARDERRAMAQLSRGFLLALAGMYALMAIALSSYLRPLVIMTAIPFGLIGALLGHGIYGIPVSMFSLLGMVALAGVVVNASIVLVDAVDGLRQDGLSEEESLLRGGRRRFRAILLTTMTTFAGLTPMMLETSFQAQFLIPMAVSLAFGVVFATGITLLLVPCIYRIADDLSTARHHTREK